MKKNYSLGVLVFLFLFYFKYTCAQNTDLNATLLELKFSNDGYPEKMTKAQNGFYFSSEDDQLWFSDGTIENTVLIKDFESGLYDDISSLTTVGTKVFFVAENRNDNRELWVSDGTEEGTIQLTDRNVGFSTESIYNIIAFKDKIYFGAYSEVYGFELWVSDGTKVGTFVLKDIAGTDKDGNPHDFFVFKDKLFFKAYSEEFGNELWISDGTPDGTVLFKDIKVGSSSGCISQGYITFNQNFYFFADNGTTGEELWKSDGTPEGTFLLKDIRAGYLSSSNKFKGSVLNDKLIFVANDGINGKELWETDGTLEGTSLFKDINIGVGNGILYDGILNLVGDKIFFTASNGADQNGLWVTDGTSQNTFFLNNAAPNLLSGNATGTFVIYFVNDVLWKSDGTVNGTTILSEEIKVTNISVSNQSYLAYGNNIFFNGKNKVNGNELWVTDGTTEGTKLFFDVNHRYGVNPSLLTAVGDKLFFRGNKYGTFGLCTTDGTLEGTRYLNIGSNEGGIDDESQFIDFNGKLIVSAHDGVHGYELWISDGTQEGTFMVKDINPGSASSIINSNIYTSFAVSNDKLYFHANDENGLGLWVSDGTSDGTYKLSKPEIKVLIGSNPSTIFTILREDIYFYGSRNGVSGLYKIDSNTGENIFIHPFVQIEHMNVANNKLLIIQDNGMIYYPERARELWASDGTTEGTSKILELADERIDHVSIFKNEFYFTAGIIGNVNNALYKSDGTVEGTVPVFTSRKLPVTTYPTSNNLVPCGEYLYFGLENSYGTINELWRTDGTPEGTVAVVSEVDGKFNSISGLSCFKDNLLFKQYSNEFDLWITDGDPNTVEGINLNITNGPIQSIYYFTPIGNKLFFSGSTNESGSEIYVAYPEGVDDDNDSDGVMNSVDTCPNTPTGEAVDTNGCSESQKDDDGDGIMNNLDNCSDTPTGEEVDENGCSESQKDDDGDGVMNDKDTCPNTPSSTNVNANGCFILPTNNFTIEVASETCPDKNNGEIIISTNETYNYTISINGNEYDFTNTKTISDLQPGTYDLCVTISEYESFKQCYSIVLEEGKTISGKSSITSKKVSIALENGTAPYNVIVNGKNVLNTFSRLFEIDVKHGDLIEVKTDVLCEGVFSKTIDLFENLTVYPNPTHGIFEIALPISLNEIKVELFTINSQLISTNTYQVINGKVQINIEKLPTAVYLVKVYLENPVSVKIIKN